MQLFCLRFWKPPFESLYLNDNIKDTLVDSNSDNEVVLDITGFHDKEVLDKHGLTGCYHSENYLNEEDNDIFTLNEWIKCTFVSKNVVNLSKRKITKAEIWLLSRGLKFFLPPSISLKQNLIWK